MLLQYITGQFSTGYKATIGTDFISKSVPHYKNSDESVTLQIWVRGPFDLVSDFLERG